jgi:phosphoglycolate phosphatase-like HAD superfamily hydrolase
MRYKAYIFDFDGVLADSVEVKTRAFAALFEEFGLEIQKKVINHHRNHGGMTRIEKFKLYFSEYLKRPLNDGALQELCDKFSTIVVDQVVNSLAILGAEAYFKNKYKKSPCYINSATPDDEIQKIVNMRGWSNYFVEIRGSGQSKTKNLEDIIAKNGYQPDEVLFFGDASSDYQAAMNCGVDFFGIVPNANAPLLKIAPNIEWSENFLNLNK